MGDLSVSADGCKYDSYGLTYQYWSAFAAQVKRSPGVSMADFQNAPGGIPVKIRYNVPNATVMDLFLNDRRVKNLVGFGWKDEKDGHTITVKLAKGSNVLRVQARAKPGQIVTIEILEPAGAKWKPDHEWKCRTSDGWIDQPFEFNLS